eukprot:Sdes_comp17296_c0_seq1m6493
MERLEGPVSPKGISSVVSSGRLLRTLRIGRRRSLPEIGPQVGQEISQPVYVDGRVPRQITGSLHSLAGQTTQLQNSRLRSNILLRTEPSQILSRKVTAMITPGTLRCSLDPNSSNILLAVADSSQDPTTLGLCWADISTGLFKITHVRRDCIAGDIARLAPSEILYDATSPPFPAAAFWKNAENYFYTPWEISALDPHCHLPKPEYFTETIMKLVPRFYDYSKHKGSLLAGCQHPQWNSVLPFMKECEKKACILLLDYLLATGNHHEPLLNSPHAHLSSTHFLPRPILNEPSFFERNHHLYMDA